ncbi:hypothetical protein GH733_001753 [Mirounga leonina]|nr:hypothetical protein GH733_001753 [Mirounga leonina]
MRALDNCSNTGSGQRLGARLSRGRQPTLGEQQSPRSRRLNSYMDIVQILQGKGQLHNMFPLFTTAHLHVDYWVSDSKVCPGWPPPAAVRTFPWQEDVRLMHTLSAASSPNRSSQKDNQGESSFWLWVKPSSL